jgi:hypothetical protein
MEACGLSLDTTDEAYDIVQPLEALVILKGLDSDNAVKYWIVKTDGLEAMDSWAMAEWAAEVSKRTVMGDG